MRVYAFISVFLLLFITSCAEREPEKIGLVEEEIEYSANGVVMKGFLVYDGDIEDKRPGVLVVHEWWGHNDYARSRARMLAELGYTAFALDMYGEGKTANHPDDAGKFASEVFSNIEESQSKFMAAYNLLNEHPMTETNQVAAVGYCFGGSVVLHMARIGTDLKAAASFHGGLSPVTLAEEGNVNAFVLVCNGADDPMVSDEHIEAFKNEMENADVRYEFLNYEGAVHAFTNPDADKFGEEFNLPLAYNEDADKESWEALKKTLDKVFSN